MTIFDGDGVYGKSDNEPINPVNGIIGKLDGQAPLTNTISSTDITTWENVSLPDNTWTQLNTTMNINKGIYLIVVNSAFSESAAATFTNNSQVRLKVNDVVGSVYGEDIGLGSWPVANQTLLSGALLKYLIVENDSTTLKVEGILDIGAGTSAAYGSLRWIRIA